MLTGPEINGIRNYFLKTPVTYYWTTEHIIQEFIHLPNLCRITEHNIKMGKRKRVWNCGFNMLEIGPSCGH
jgi:hypothetical protein